MLPNGFVKKVTVECKQEIYNATICISKFKDSSSYDYAKSYLMDDERSVISSYKFEKRKNSYILGRYCAKKAIEAYEEDPIKNNVIIENGIFNQPIIVGYKNTNLNISLTHTSDLGGAIVYPEKLIMGIDIEKVVDSNIKTLENQCTKDERALINRICNSPAKNLTLLWTAKESLSKALKTGMMTPFSIFEIIKAESSDDFVYCFYEHFPQYKTLSFYFDEYICSITHPAHAHLQLDITELMNF